jgi:LysM repeat protein
MISPNYMDIGAGVAAGSDGTVYYVVDTARHTASGQPQDEAASLLTSTVNAPADALSQYILPVVRSTARPDGDVVHRVQYGQSLWSIAIEYGTTIDKIRSLNNLDDTTVYDGQVLLVQKGATRPAPPTAAPATLPTLSPAPGTTPTIALDFQSPTVSLPPASGDETRQTGGGDSIMNVVLGLLLFALVVGGGTAVWFIRDPRQAQPGARR